MQVYLKLLANYREYLPHNTQGYQISIEISPEITAEMVLDQFFVPQVPESVLLVNGKTPEANAPLQEGDVICAFPAMAGG